MGHGFTKTGERVLHEGYVITLVTATFEGPAGEVMERDVVHHPGAVAVVAVDGGEVVLVRQYRPVMEREMLEIPAGKLDVIGEDRQEAGLYARDLVEMGRFHNSIGFCDEETTIFLATDLEPVASEAVSVEESYLTVERVPLDDVEAMIVDGAITDAKTVIGLLQVLRRLGR